VVNELKAMLPKMRSLVPDDVHIDLAFDQSIYVKGAISGLVTEGLLGAVLTVSWSCSFCAIGGRRSSCPHHPILPPRLPSSGCGSSDRP